MEPSLQRTPLNYRRSSTSRVPKIAIFGIKNRVRAACQKSTVRRAAAAADRGVTSQQAANAPTIARTLPLSEAEAVMPIRPLSFHRICAGTIQFVPNRIEARCRTLLASLHGLFHLRSVGAAFASPHL
jgi:hypothetical protein